MIERERLSRSRRGDRTGSRVSPVHLVDEGDDRDVAQAADLEQLGACVPRCPCRIDHHHRRIDRGERAVRVLPEKVLVARRVEQVEDVAHRTRTSSPRVTTENAPRLFSIAIQSERVGDRGLRLAFLPRRRAGSAPPKSSSFSCQRWSSPRPGARMDGEGAPHGDGGRRGVRRRSWRGGFDRSGVVALKMGQNAPERNNRGRLATPANAPFRPAPVVSIIPASRSDP